MLGCLFVFFTTSNWLVSGSVPLLEIGVALLLVGSASYLPFARVNGFWPFDQRAGETGNSEMSPPSEKAGGPGRAGGRGIKATPSTPEGQAPNSSRPTYYPSSAEQQTASSSPSSSLGRSSHPQTYPHKPR